MRKTGILVAAAATLLLWACAAMANSLSPPGALMVWPYVPGGFSGLPGPPAPGSGDPCDIIYPTICGEAYSLTRAMAGAYHGPLFQLTRISDLAILDIGQTAGGKVDLSTWSAFCSGVPANCVYSTIYGQIHGNNLVPSVFDNGQGTNCSAGGITCAAPFEIEPATGLPAIFLSKPDEYTLTGDNGAVGIPAGANAVTVIVNGASVPTTTACCGIFGISHKWNAGDTVGTDFILVLAYGQFGGAGVPCGTTTTYCTGIDEEFAGDIGDYGSAPINTIAMVDFAPSTNTVAAILNGATIFSNSPPNSTINPGSSIHFGGGGDLAQPADSFDREMMIVNGAISPTQEAAIRCNMVAFYSTLTFSGSTGCVAPPPPSGTISVPWLPAGSTMTR